MYRRGLDGGDRNKVRTLQTSTVILHMLVYCAMLRNGPSLRAINPQVLFACLGMAYVVYFVNLYRFRPAGNVASLLDMAGFEILTIPAVIASLYFHFQFMHILLYHFVFWNLYPIPMFVRISRAKLIRYLTAAVAFTAVCFVLSPFGLVKDEYYGSIFQQQFLLWSYIHITSSFALSNYHPKWIVNLFRPRTAVASI